MPDDVGGRPFPDGSEPDDDRGGADEDFASVVFDEDFVRSAEVHEPTAVERLLAAAQARAEAEAARAGAGMGASDDDPYPDGYEAYDRDRPRAPDGAVDDGWSANYSPYDGALRPYRSTARWHRPVAWVLALLMGIGMVALAFTAVYRGAAGNRQDQVPAPATTGVDSTRSNQAPAPGAGTPGTPGPPGSAADPNALRDRVAVSSAPPDRPAAPVPMDPRTP
ncbi:SCO2584 family spore wall biosynthesis protein [Streptomyces sp. NPDC003860]